MSIGFTILKNAAATPQRITAQKQLSFTEAESQQTSYFYYNTNDKFEKDKLFAENKQYIYGIDGIIINLQELKNGHAQSSWPELYVYLYEKHKQNLPAQLKGDFCGFIFEKATQNLLTFNNPGGSRRMYYTQIENSTIVASSMQQITVHLQATQTKAQLNRFAAYSMLTYGAMFGNLTYIKGVHRLLAGESLSVKSNQLSVQKYVDYNNINYISKSENAIVDELDERFVHALRLEMDKDLEYDYQAIGTLSGGMDSRMSVMLAHELGYKIKPFCFSQSGYHDELIAREIAKSMGEELAFIPLDSARHLFDYEENMEAYDGLSFFLGSAHFAWGLKQLDLSQHGMIHTGMIGDGVFGVGLSGPKVRPANTRSKLISDKLYPRIEKEVDAFAKNYSNEESFYLYNRLLNLTITGTYICAPYGYHSTPFMDSGIIKLMMSVPPEMKYFHRLYLYWINRHHPAVTKFKWERTRMRPTAHWKTKLSRYTNKLEHLFRNYSGQSHKLTMTPYDLWRKQYPEIELFFNQLYKEKINLIANDKELSTDVQKLFENGSLVEKSMVLTLLGSIERFKIEV